MDIEPDRTEEKSDTKTGKKKLQWEIHQLLRQNLICFINTSLPLQLQRAMAQRRPFVTDR